MECEHTAMFSSCSHHNLSTFLTNVSRTPAIFSRSVSRAGAMFLSRAADVFEQLQITTPRARGGRTHGLPTCLARLHRGVVWYDRPPELGRACVEGCRDAAAAGRQISA